MNKIKFLIFLFVAYFAHGKYVFSESMIKRWVTDHAARAISNPSSACDDLSDNYRMQVTNLKGKLKLESDKAKSCKLMSQMAAALTSTQGKMNVSYDNFNIKQDGFPWLRARVSYTEDATVSLPRGLKRKTHSEDTMVLERTLSGVKLISVVSKTKL